jgi:PAS domain S-box-containing protein
MDDQSKTREQLAAELAALRQRVALLEQAEKAQRESEERFRQVFEEGPTGFLLVGLDGQIHRCNRRFCEMLGYSESELVGRSVPDISHPDDWQRDYPFISRLFHGEISCYHVDKRYIRKDGQPVWVQLTVSLRRDKAGMPVDTIGMVEEITERKRAEEALRESEERYRRLAESTTDMIYIANRTGDILYANPSAAAAMGCNASNIVGKRQEELFPPERAQQHIKSIGQVYETGEIFVSDGVYRFGSEDVWLNSRLIPLRDDCGQVVAVMGVSRNITPRKRAEEALQRAHDELERRVEERTAELREANKELGIFRRFAEASVQGFGIADLTGCVTYVNPALCRMMGENRPEDVVGRQFSNYVAGDSQRLLRDEYFPAMFREGSWAREGAMLTRQGTITPIFNSNFLIRDNEGKPAYLATVITDIAERRQAEESLRRSEEKYKRLVEACPDAVVMSDLSGSIIFASKQSWNLLGLPDSVELVGTTVFDHVIEADRERLAHSVSNLLKAAIRLSEEYTLARPDGATLPVEASFATMLDTEGHPQAHMAVIRDITERKRAEAALRQSRDELQAIYDQVREGIMIVDAANITAVHVNHAFCRMLGYSVDEMRTVSRERLNPPEVHHIAIKHTETVRQGTVAKSENVPFLRKDGGVVYFDVVSSPIRYDDRPCWISFFHDVTERKRAEESLQREHRTLKHLLHSSDHERQLIAYEIHDELAQQLAAAIMQFQAYICQEKASSEDAFMAFNAGMKLLQQGHIEARRLIAGVRPPILDEEGVVPAVSHLVNEEMRQKGSQIEFRHDVQFDRLAPTLENTIYRIVQEGLTNACQHSRSKKVRVVFFQKDDRVRIEIRDWGTGFDVKTVPENRFGLMGIRQRVRLLGGKWSIRSRAGKGTRIVVELPVVERE